MRCPSVLLSSVLALCALAAHAAEAPACRNQSPRNINPHASPPPFDGTSTESIVRHNDFTTVVYRPRGGGREQTLHLCGMHYHRAPENDQGCRKAGSRPETAGGGAARAGDLVELHYAYAASIKTEGCDFRHLDCCVDMPYLVYAEQVNVVDPSDPAASGPHRWRLPGGRPQPQRFAEWTGSTTGPDKQPGECKPEAQWSFRLDCGTMIDPLTLAILFGPEGQDARPLQTGDRLSRDLFLVTPRH